MSTESATNPADGEVLPEDEVANDSDQAQDGADGEGQGDGEGSQDDETEDYELDGGAKLTVPKAVAALLKEGTLRQADYTQKTQALAADRTTLAEDRKAHGEQVKVQAELLDKRAELKVVEKDLDVYRKMTPDEWGKLRTENHEAFDQHRLNFDYLKDQKATLSDEVKAGETKALEGQRTQSAKAVEQGLATLQKDIPDFTPAYFGKLVTFGGQLGYGPQEVQAALADPRQIKILHRLFVAEEALAKAKKTGRIEQAAAVRPAVRVGAAAPANKDPTRMSTDAWMAHRRAELAKKGGR